MTAAEQQSLERLAEKVDAGFRELRELMEARRVEEVRVQGQLEERVRFVEARSFANERILRVAAIIATLIISTIALAHGLGAV